MERRGSIVINSIDVGMPIKKDLDELMTATPRYNMKRRASKDISSVDIGTSVKEELDGWCMFDR